jgi:hypothetical protein
MGITSWPAGSQDKKRWARTGSPKQSNQRVIPNVKTFHLMSMSFCCGDRRGQSGQVICCGDRLLLIIKKQPAHPPPVKSAPPSGNLLMSILPKTSITRKGKNEIKDNESKNSPSAVSSEEPVLDTNLNKDEKEDKKTAEAN